MKSAEPNKLYRKSGVWGTLWFVAGRDPNGGGSAVLSTSIPCKQRPQIFKADGESLFSMR